MMMRADDDAAAADDVAAAAVVVDGFVDRPLPSCRVSSIGGASSLK